MTAMIQKTTNYDIFKQLSCNRKKRSKHVQNLANSIKNEANLLHIDPIIVDEDMYVIDGNHRLEAARKLGVPIYYRVCEDVNDTHMHILNKNKLNWATIDFLHYHIEKECPEYLLFQSLCNKYKLTLEQGVKFISTSHDMINIIKKGKFKCPDPYTFCNKVENFYRIHDFLKQKIIGEKAFLNSLTFSRAVLNFLNLENVDIEKFIAKLERKLPAVRRCAGYKEYLQNFIDIYNWNIKDKKQIIRNKKEAELFNQ